MLIVMKAGASRADVAAVEDKIRALGFTPNEIPGSTRLAIGITGNQGPLDPGMFTVMSGVADAVAVSKPWKLVSREVKPDDSFIDIGGACIGGGRFGVIAGPCAVESREQVDQAATAVKAAGAHFLRGGAFKPRTSPYAFQGMKEDGLKILADAREKTGLPIVTEVMEPALIGPVAEVADVLQIGSRNMQNFPLLRAAGQANRPILLKRGFAATIEEWLLAAEYILAAGNLQVMLCERGVRSFDPSTRNLLDLSCVPLLATLTHLPVLVDPSHGVGRSDLVETMSVAAVAAGADGLLIEMHPHPAQALTDAEQAISPQTLRSLVERAERVYAALHP